MYYIPTEGPKLSNILDLHTPFDIPWNIKLSSLSIRLSRIYIMIYIIEYVDDRCICIQVVQRVLSQGGMYRVRRTAYAVSPYYLRS